MRPDLRILLAALLCLASSAVFAAAQPNAVVPDDAAATGKSGDPGDTADTGHTGDVDVRTRPWAATLYTVWLSEEQLGDMLLFQSALESSQLWVAALSRRIGSLNRHIDAEIEGQIGKHAGPIQRHWEFNGLGTLRWRTFPWNRTIGTTAAVGIGLSYASVDPEFEYMAHDATSKLLVYIMVELTFSLPSAPQWAAVARIHHRSAAYGTFEKDLEGASNAAGIGIKYRF